MDRVLRWLLCAALYAVFAAVIGYLSFWPRYQYASPDRAVVKLSVSHATQRVLPCVRLSPEQVAALPPNMRRQESCERERLPLVIELDVDAESMLRVVASPSGLWRDGPASIYERIELMPGTRTVAVRMRDSARETGWDYTHRGEITLVAGRYTTITFAPENGGFEIR